MNDIKRIHENWMSTNGVKLELEIRKEPSHEVLMKADCAIVKSGTSTLEAMLLEVPFAMVYRVSFPSWLLLRPFVRTGTYCLANLIAGKQVVPEFVQKNATGQQIGAYMVKLLSDPEERSKVRDELAKAKLRLGNQDAYDEAARKISGRFFQNI
jgi:lipid-A-disaccharide synthase